MKLGTQQGDAEEMLRAFAAFGVNNICGSLPSRAMDEAWSVDALSKRRDRVKAHGISLDMLPLPMSSAGDFASRDAGDLPRPESRSAIATSTTSAR